MKIATFNINNINRRLPNLLAWMRTAKPDVVALQELKASDGEFPAAAIEKAGYGAVWCGQKTWNGVAILARNAEPILTRDRLPGKPADHEARYIEAAVRGVIVTSIYLPNGNPQPGPKFDYKLAWFERLIAHAQALLDAGTPVVLAGDFNVVPTDADIYNAWLWRWDAVMQPQTQQAYQRLLGQGWIDSTRHLHPKDRVYTFWVNANAFRRNAGFRMDFLLLSPDLAPRLRAAGVDTGHRGREGASDHAPTWIELAGG